MALLVDSNVFIGMERRGLTLADFSRIGPDEVTALSSITASELLIGVTRSVPSPRTTARALFVEAILEQVPILPFDLAAARIHARIWADLATAGTPIGPHDLLIAATVFSHSFAVLTDNIDEFQRVPYLRVVRPTWPR